MHLKENFLSWAIKPKTIFGLGAVQALWPYLKWEIYGENDNYFYTITYYPLIIWLSGFILFCIGCSLSNFFNYRYKNNLILSLSRVNVLHNYFLIIYTVAIIFMISAYKGIPLLNFINGSYDINDVNQIQLDSGTSIFGFTHLIGSFLTAILSISIGFCIINSLKFGYKNIITIIILLFGAVLAGKRQDLLILISVLFGSAILFTKKINRIEIRSKLTNNILFLLLLLIVIIILVFGIIGAIRISGNNSSSLNQIGAYLDYPLINMEWQLLEFGFWEGQGNNFPLVSGLFPYKFLIDDNLYGNFSELIYGFTYPEPGIGSGFFGQAHLSLGYLGVLLYGLFSGFFSNLIFNLARRNIIWVVPYCFFIWPLFASHSYNHFTNLLFFPLPFFGAIILSKIIFINKGLSKKYEDR